MPAPNGNNNKKEVPKSSPVTINKAPPLPPLPTKSKKEINTISKYFQPKKNSIEASNHSPKSNTGKSYAQASKPSFNTSEVLKIKETFPSLNAKKIEQVNNIVNGQNKIKPRIKMTTKGPSRKKIIIPMSNDNVVSFIKNSSSHVANINRSLRNAKTDILVDYVRSDNTGISVIVNKIAHQLDIAIIDNYIKNSTDINSLQVEEARLLMSKFKVSPKSDMALVWIDIWDIQSGKNAKMLINRCFNVGNHIATIRGANMNPGVPLCKNCWKWGHATMSCRIQGARCAKCNGPHKSEHHREFGWCCKANDKVNPPRLETKRGEPCPHMFKCSNCKGDHQVDSVQCPFWRHRFNCEWHIKKYAEIRENRSNSLCSNVNAPSNQ